MRIYACVEGRGIGKKIQEKACKTWNYGEGWGETKYS